MPHPAAERGSATVTVATAAALLLLLLAVIAGAVGGITGQEASACTAQPAASSAAASIPANYLADFKKAGTEYGIPWTVLAAIGEVESGYGAERRAVQRRRPRPHAVRAVDLGAVRRRREHHGPGRRHPRRRPPPGRERRARQPPAGASSPTTTPASYVTDVLAWAARYAAGGAQAVSAAGSAVCQQAALGPLPAGTAGKILAYAEAQLGKPYSLRGDRPGRLRLLGPGHDGLPRRRDRHPPHQPGPVGLRHPDPRQPGPAGRPGLLRRSRRHPGRPRARRHRPGPGRPHHDRRLRHRLPRGRRHLRAPRRPREGCRPWSASPARRRESRPGRPPRWRGGPAWQQARRQALPAGSRRRALLRAGRRRGCTACGGPACCRWPQVAEQGPGAPGAVGLDQEPDLGTQAAVVHLGGLPAVSVVDEVVQVPGLQAESGGPGGQLVRLAGLAAVPGRAGAGQPAGAGACAVSVRIRRRAMIAPRCRWSGTCRAARADAEARRQRHSSKGTEALPIGLEAAVGDSAAWIIVTALPSAAAGARQNSIH